ncbi:MAG TPA: phospholipid scramblase-related protein [Candidatus Ozemobacteraceae bacterium]|nr:phospholipid scramblase-related protein [Candidatus Ozemobacteraceae bacterium]
MNGLFGKRVIGIHESVGAAELREAYLITDETGCTRLGSAVERASAGRKIAKAFFDKSWLPVTVDVTDETGKKLLELDAAGWRPYAKITVKNADGAVIGILHEAGCTFKPRLDVTDAAGAALGTCRGDLFGRVFSFTDATGAAIGRIEHLWGGAARELLTTADDYRVEVTGDQAHSPLVLAAALAVDLIWHEN